MSKVSSWRPLNVEYEQEAEDEVDDTQEIQIEEALKLYQTALKYHSEGPESFDKTAAAYRELFASEIFKYNESLSEYQRHEAFGESLVFDSILEDDFEAGPAQTTGAADSAPNTLPQILHLSYKNHGQFLLESMQYWVSQHGAIPQMEGWNNIRGALNYFSEALDKEDTDLDLWLRAASVSAMLGSKRLTRYCLEAVLDGNDELWENLLRLPGLEEGFAGHQLRELVERLEDNVSLMQAPLSSMKRKKLSDTIKKRLNPFSFAPLPADVAHADVRPMLTQPAQRVVLTPTKWDWAGLGETILQQFMAESQGIATNMASGSSLNFNIPPDDLTPEPIELEPAAAAITPSPPVEAAEGVEVAGAVDVAAEQEKSAEDDIDKSIVQAQEGAPETKDAASSSAIALDAVPPPSRKRSTDSAGLPETADGARSRSKRIRARDTITEPSAGGDAVAQEANKQLDEQLEQYTHADQCLYEIVKDIYARLGVEDVQDPTNLRSLLANPPPPPSCSAFDKAACDMFSALQSGNGKAAQILLSNESFDLVGVTREAGLNAFLGYAKAGTGQTSSKPPLESQKLGTFARIVNEGWLSTKEVAFAWVEFLLSCDRFPAQEVEDHEVAPSSYMQFKWSDELKRNLVQIIVNLDDYIHECMLERIASLNTRILAEEHLSCAYNFTTFDESQAEIIETLFELHLDIYSLIKHPHSQVDSATQILQSDRLERWSTLAREIVQLRSACRSNLNMDDLNMRHIWASVFQMSVNDDIPPEHVVSAIAELKAILDAQGDRTIQVQNNAIMPEMCIAAVERELVRISMKDFFLKVFDHDEKDPVTVIESLEPILEENHEQNTPAEATTESNDPDGDAASSSTMSNGTNEQTAVLADQPSPIVEMRKFLDAANVNVRVSLWHRLREAYEAIEYSPKVLSCYLRIIETFVTDFKSTNFQELSDVERQVKLLTRFRVIDDLITKTLQIIKDDKSAFDCLSYEHVQSSMASIVQLLHILSAADMFRDMIRIGHVAMPRVEALPAQAFVNMSTKLDDMHIRLWMVQYHLLKEALSQNAENFPTPSEDLFEFLRHVHHATGVRRFCHQSSRHFLRLAKDEILRLDDVIDANSRDTELCQVLHDLYGLKLFIEPLECQDFSSTPDILDKKTAFGILPFVMSQVKKVDLKDLPKTELRGTIDKVHAALGRPKQHKDLSFNHKLITAWFKSPIHPASLLNCLKGVGSLSAKHVPAEEAVAASMGWYYLMGDISLSKFRSQKRMTQGPTEDLSYAQAFFIQDLEYSTDRWETWYRLAQVNDLQLEEVVSWTADKINSGSIELINHQRGAINCYTMAVACAVREADAQSQSRVGQMYTEFANRMYASSREPFSMEAFQFRENEKKFCNPQYQTGVIKEPMFQPLYLYTAWKIANALYKRAIQENPNKWWNYYMLGKCSWKMWSTNEDDKHYTAAIGAPPSAHRVQPTWASVTDAIINAIDTLPNKKGRSSEPILEPHYKLVSIAHKLFQKRAIDHVKGVELLSHTSFSKNVAPPENVEGWERYILAVLKSLRSADKSSWHHRIISRSAHVIFDEGKDSMMAHGAKHELTQQMFTKTMAVQVWKPENERPGRHFVYTTRYTRFFVDLLDLTGDKANFEALAKRVRRKTADFFEHSKLWQDLCMRYLKMLRKLGNIPEGQEDSAFKSVNQEEFNTLALRMEAWCQNPLTQHPVLDILRDAIELKRLNNGLMKPLQIDDLIGDTYALLYTTIGPSLPPLPSEQQQQQLVPPTQPFIAQHGGALPISSLMQVQVDGAGDRTNQTPFAIYHPSQLLGPQMQAPQPEPVVKPRAKAVGRREIGRRAEACVQKPVTSAAASQSTAMPIRSPPALNATIPTFSPRNLSPDKSAQPTTAPVEQLDPSFDQSGSATAAASVNNDDQEPEVSAPPSAHYDDADDESELSELDEEEVQEIEQEIIAPRRSVSIAAKPMFPNLFAERKSTEKQGEGNDVSDTIHVQRPGAKGKEAGNGDKMDVE
ncbi:histone transcription regulator 3 [Parastagonospora nodorum]|nr:histone transcription regulator 3 [Parastagonospora nodorum]KAH5224985.1 histone transcription regulator 3 [Parastagonospora nodorum]KAH5387543.1 histone transcription regulator 3 [Parastagonospora nodorum]KAH6152926.1 histone transcription regulator 3 [Parastagonospora nodorum]KAH6187032.1 histone transcription regulator 3 [Parastagonospora nodorum]